MGGSFNPFCIADGLKVLYSFSEMAVTLVFVSILNMASQFDDPLTVQVLCWEVSTTSK